MYDKISSLQKKKNMDLDVIRTANPFLYTSKFMFVGFKNNKTQQIRR